MIISKHLKWLFLACFIVSFSTVSAEVNFEDWFENKTLRLDYIFSGDRYHQHIAIEQILSSPGWYGRRHHLDQLYQEGNGQIIVKDKETSTIIYEKSFSTLFQEWQTTAEAKQTNRAFENTFLIPYPKRSIEITLQLTDTRRNISSTFTHSVDPEDILIRALKPMPGIQVRTIQSALNSKASVNVAILAEGYTAQEMPLFFGDAEKAVNALFAHHPFMEYGDRFQIIAVGVPSIESGVSIPKNQDWKQTPLSSQFSTFYSDRYLTTEHQQQMHDILAGLPYAHIIVLANTDEYGGGGIYNAFTLTTAHHSGFKPVVVHEFGHSFAGLGDEYAYDDEDEVMYPRDIEPWEKNITTLVDFASKWKNLLPPHTSIPTLPTTDSTKIYKRIGVFEGAGYQSKGVYRPYQDCRMRTNTAPGFCPVCQRIIRDLILYYTE